MAYQVFQVNKTGSTATVTFNPPFANPPVVIVMSSLIGGSSMGSVETVTAISTTGATIISGNQAPNYWVNVLAIDVDSPRINELPVLVGSVPKTASTLQIPLSHDAPLPSVNLLSPFWIGSSQGVSDVDTLTDESDGGITVVSGNAATSGYNTQYLNAALCADAGAQTGIVNKQGTIQRVYFTRSWPYPPIVFVSPWWNGGSGVGAKEFIREVTTDYFDVMSGNNAQNYFDCWLAVPTPNNAFPTNLAGNWEVTIDGLSPNTGALTLSILSNGTLSPTATWNHTAGAQDVAVGWAQNQLSWVGPDHVYTGRLAGDVFNGTYCHPGRKRGSGNWTARQTTTK